MSLTVKSPIKRFPGEVVFNDPLTFPQSIAFQDAVTQGKDQETDTRADLYEYIKIMVPAIAGCIESHTLDGVVMKPDQFPSTPNVSAQELLGWLTMQIVALHQEAEPDDPNE